MDIPIELLIDYMGYLNPDVRLRERGGWVKGIKLLLEAKREGRDRNGSSFLNVIDVLGTEGVAPRPSCLP